MKKNKPIPATGRGKMGKQAMRAVVGGFYSCCMAPESWGCMPGTCENPRTGATETCYCQRPIE